MPDQPFMLVSLEEAKAKKLAQVLNNETCTKVLNHLAVKKEGTETEIAKGLKLPLSTVHYNLKQLVEAKLVVADEYHYSEKGREVNHYKLANKYIIIAPQEERQGFLEKLQQFLPATLIMVGLAAVLWLLGLFTGTLGGRAAAPAAMMKGAMYEEAIMPLAEQAMPAAESAVASEAAAKAVDMVAAPMAAGAGEALQESVEEGARAMMLTGTNEAANQSLNQTLPHALGGVAPPPMAESHPPIALWLSKEVILAFLIGGLFVIGLLILLAWLKSRKK